MKLKNHTTAISHERSISEIQAMLITFGAENVMLSAENKEIKEIKFTYRINDRLYPFKLPVNIEKTTDILWKEYSSKSRRGRKSRNDFIEEARRIAWRIARDWIHSQLSILAIEAVRFEEVFLGYLMMPDDKTLSEKIVHGEFKKMLPEFVE